jgi:TatD DNase family protein
VIYDAHNHLQDPRLAPWRNDFARLGVARAVVNGTSEKDWPEVLQLARAHSWVIPSLGLHPWFVPERGPDWLKTLRELLDQHRCAIGEIGLDRWIENPDLPAQEEVFQAQLALAAERNLPVTIHCLKAWGRLLEILQKSKLPNCGFLLHSYGGSAEMIKSFADLGAYFSISGYFAHERKSRQREAFRSVPLDRLLIETDAPDMPLPDNLNQHPLPNALNHPANIEPIYQFTSELLNLPRPDLEQTVEANFHKLFGPLLEVASANP